MHWRRAPLHLILLIDDVVSAQTHTDRGKHHLWFLIILLPCCWGGEGGSRDVHRLVYH